MKLWAGRSQLSAVSAQQRLINSFTPRTLHIINFTHTKHPSRDEGNFLSVLLRAKAMFTFPWWHWSTLITAGEMGIYPHHKLDTAPTYPSSTSIRKNYYLPHSLPLPSQHRHKLLPAPPGPSPASIGRNYYLPPSLPSSLVCFLVGDPSLSRTYSAIVIYKLYIVSCPVPTLAIVIYE